MSKFGTNKSFNKTSNSNTGTSKFTRVGDLTVSKKTQQELGDKVVDDLKESKMNLWLNVYIPEGTELVLKKGDKIMLSFAPVTTKDGKEISYVVGKALIAGE